MNNNIMRLNRWWLAVLFIILYTALVTPPVERLSSEIIIEMLIMCAWESLQFPLCDYPTWLQNLTAMNDYFCFHSHYHL